MTLYKVGTVANSCSTMHKIAAKEFTLDDFSHEHLGFQSVRVLKDTIKVMNDFREEFIKDHEKENWWQMIQLLPSFTTSGEQSCSTMRYWPTSTRAGGTISSTSGIPSATGLRDCLILR